VALITLYALAPRNFLKKVTKTPISD